MSLFWLDLEGDKTGQMKAWEVANDKYKANGSWYFVEGKWPPITSIEDANVEVPTTSIPHEIVVDNDEGGVEEKLRTK